MAIVVVALVGLGALFYVLYPVLRQERFRALIPSPEEEHQRELESRRNATYSAIKELEFDFELGNLAPDDHAELEEKYRTQAISILKEMDAAPALDPTEAELEAEVASRRRTAPRRPRRQALPAQAIEAEVAQRRGGEVAEGGAFCPRCGTRSHLGDLFCARCGQ